MLVKWATGLRKGVQVPTPVFLVISKLWFGGYNKIYKKPSRFKLGNVYDKYQWSWVLFSPHFKLFVEWSIQTRQWPLNDHTSMHSRWGELCGSAALGPTAGVHVFQVRYNKGNMAKLHSLLPQEWATQLSGHMQYNYNMLWFPPDEVIFVPGTQFILIYIFRFMVASQAFKLSFF